MSVCMYVCVCVKGKKNEALVIRKRIFIMLKYSCYYSPIAMNPIVTGLSLISYIY